MINEYSFYFAYTPLWPGADNMELDRFLGETEPPDLPLLRLYTWDRPTISYGCHQNPSKRLLLELCVGDGIPVVQRPTGGRELLHGHDVCYTVIWPFRDGVRAVESRRVFAAINDTLLAALRVMGISAQWNEFRNRPKTLDGPCFVQVDTGEITVGGRKLVASAQRVYERCIVQQGSIPLSKPRVDLLKYLRVSDKARVAETMEATTAFLNENAAEVYSAEALGAPFAQAFEGLFGGPSGPGDEFLRSLKGINKTQHGIFNNLK